MPIQNIRRLGDAPAAPPAAVPQETAEGYELVLDVTLTALQSKPDLSIFVDQDGDFVWLATKGASTGAYTVRFRLPNSKYTSSAPLYSTVKVGTGAFPVPEFPPRRLPASARIVVDIVDLSNSGNTVHLVLIGQKMLRSS